MGFLIILMLKNLIAIWPRFHIDQIYQWINIAINSNASFEFGTWLLLQPEVVIVYSIEFPIQLNFIKQHDIFFVVNKTTYEWMFHNNVSPWMIWPLLEDIFFKVSQVFLIKRNKDGNNIHSGIWMNEVWNVLVLCQFYP